MLEKPFLRSSDERASIRGLRNLYRALYLAPEELAVHVRTLDLSGDLPSRDAKELLSMLFLVPNLTDLRLTWTKKWTFTRSPYKSQHGGERRRPRLAKLSLSLADASDYTSFRPWFVGLTKNCLDLGRLEKLALSDEYFPGRFLRELGHLLPSTLQRLTLKEEVTEGAFTGCLSFIAASFSLLSSLDLHIPYHGPHRPSSRLEALLTALPNLRHLRLQHGCFDGFAGPVHHPTLERLELKLLSEPAAYDSDGHAFSEPYWPDTPPGFEVDHVLRVAVENICRRIRKDSNAFPALRSVRLLTDERHPHFLSFYDGECREWIGVADMARKLKDVGISLRDLTNRPWRDEWFDDPYLSADEWFDDPDSPAD